VRAASGSRGSVVHAPLGSTLGTNVLQLFDKYARDDSVVKAVFDHVRNIGLAAAVLAACAWTWKHAAPMPIGLVDYVASIFLGLIGVGLFWVNHENIFYKLRQKPLSVLVHGLLAFLYLFAIFVFIRFVLGDRVGA
jgi:hypothetical protein